jgi:diguanylate cyclase (GGDEF)-like protein
MKAFINRLSYMPAIQIALIVLLALAIDFSGITWRIEQMVVDIELSLIPQDLPEDIVIVAVDEKSLRKYGRWPWSRHMHAQLLDRLTLAGTGSVVFDVLFADPSRGDAIGDQLFADAISRHGKVVLAMSSDEDPKDGVVSEVLPLPLFAQAAAGIGHSDMGVDRDGIVRGAYLLAGAGVARWPELALSALYVAGKHGVTRLPGETFAGSRSIRKGRWIRDHKILFPYVGGPGSFPMFSFADVVDGRVPLQMLQEKVVFVGITATSIRRVFPIPGENEGAMSGVEIHANVFNALENSKMVTKVQGLPHQLGVGFLALCAALIIVFARFSCFVNRLLFAVLASSLLSLLAVLILGLSIPVVPVWSSLVIVSYWLTRRHIGNLQQTSVRDPLTGLGNRRAFEAHFEHMWHLNKRHRRLLFLLIIDVDHFKRYNDLMGHLQGDQALKKLGKYLESKTRRAGDKACRIGGEEFVVLLDMDEVQNVEAYAQEIVDGIEHLEMYYHDNVSRYHLTVSVGCAGIVPGGRHTREELFELADQALYKAKNTGRNRVFCQWFRGKESLQKNTVVTRPKPYSHSLLKSD